MRPANSRCVSIRCGDGFTLIELLSVVIRVDLNDGGSTTPPTPEQCAEFPALQ
jgi:hypothetical protein